jgi:hypothetical protein
VIFARTGSGFPAFPNLAGTKAVERELLAGIEQLVDKVGLNPHVA